MNAILEKIMELGSMEDRACSDTERKLIINEAEELYNKHLAELNLLNIPVSGMLLSDYAKEKLEYINGNCIARDFPKEQPTKEWAGAVLDLLEDMKLGNYR